MDGQPLDQGKLVAPGYINADPPGEPFFALTVGEDGVGSSIARAGGEVIVDAFGGINMQANSGSFVGIDSFADITIEAIGTGVADIVNAGTIAFRPTGAGSLTGVKTINGDVYPPSAPEPAPLTTGITDDLTQLTWTQIPMSSMFYIDYDIGTTVISTTNIQCTTINSNPDTASSCWLINVTPDEDTNGNVRFYCGADPGTYDTIGPLYISWLITNP